MEVKIMFITYTVSVTTKNKGTHNYYVDTTTSAKSVARNAYNSHMWENGEIVDTVMNITVNDIVYYNVGKKEGGTGRKVFKL